MDEEPVNDREFVYRRVHRSFFDVSLAMPIQREAFRPNRNDATGLSVFRSDFVLPADTLANIDPAKARDYCVCRLAVADLLNLGLTVMPEPIADGPRGHAVIPELSWPAYVANKQRLKEVQLELARLASAGIVLPSRS